MTTIRLYGFVYFYEIVIFKQNYLTKKVLSLRVLVARHDDDDDETNCS